MMYTVLAIMIQLSTKLYNRYDSTSVKSIKPLAILLVIKYQKSFGNGNEILSIDSLKVVYVWYQRCYLQDEKQSL